MKERPMLMGAPMVRAIVDGGSAGAMKADRTPEQIAHEEETWTLVLVAVRALWLMWKEGEFRPCGKPEIDILDAYDHAALLYPEHSGAALLTELAAARAVVAAMRQIDRHVIGAYETAAGSVEPCDECGEMREIAAQALAAYDAATLDLRVCD